MPELQSRPVACASVFSLDSRLATLCRNLLRLWTPTCSVARFARALIPPFAVWPAKRPAWDKPPHSWPEVFPARSRAAEKGTGPAWDKRLTLAPHWRDASGDDVIAPRFSVLMLDPRAMPDAHLFAESIPQRVASLCRAIAGAASM